MPRSTPGPLGGPGHSVRQWGERGEYVSWGIGGSARGCRITPPREPRLSTPGCLAQAQLGQRQRSGKALGEEPGEGREGRWGKLTQPPQTPLLRQRLPGGANLPSKVAAAGQPDRKLVAGPHPGPLAPARRSGLAWASHVGPAASLGNEAEACPTAPPPPRVCSCAGRKEPARAAGACSGRVCTRSHVSSARTCSTSPPHAGSPARVEMCTRPHARGLVSGAPRESAEPGTTAPPSGCSGPQPGKVRVMERGRAQAPGWGPPSLPQSSSLLHWRLQGGNARAYSQHLDLVAPHFRSHQQGPACGFVSGGQPCNPSWGGAGEDFAEGSRRG